MLTVGAESVAVAPVGTATEHVTVVARPAEDTLTGIV